MELLYKLENFEGPLDLLLHLIEKDKINIYDIPIVHITKQYLDFVKDMGEDAELMSIAVLEEYRNRRYASRLMEVMFKICEENKVEKIFLELRESNLLAYKLYREHGFVNMGIRREYYTNPVENAVLMYKQLTDCAG